MNEYLGCAEENCACLEIPSGEAGLAGGVDPSSQLSLPHSRYTFRKPVLVILCGFPLGKWLSDHLNNSSFNLRAQAHKMKQVRAHFSQIPPEPSLQIKKPEQDPALLGVWGPRQAEDTAPCCRGHSAGQDAQRWDPALPFQPQHNEQTHTTVCFMSHCSTASVFGCQRLTGQ